MRISQNIFCRQSRNLLLLFSLTFTPALTLTAPAQSQPPAVADAHRRGDLTGNWQGTLQAGKPLRVLLAFAPAAGAGFTGKMYILDQSPQGFAISQITVDPATVKFTVGVVSAEFTGALSPDGATLTGTWTQGATPLPLTLVRATKETAWEIPAAPAPEKRMAADADPAFDVATIKPNADATSMQQLTLNGRDFTVRGASLLDLISFAYQVQKKQVVNAPEWADKDRYDIAAVPDVEGAPSPAQLRLMIKKLIAERFKLTSHTDTRDLSAFVLTVAKSGPKLTPTELTGPLPGLGIQPGKGGIKLIVRNGTIADLTQFLESLVLDRPVVDRTALPGKYDINITFTPDDSLFNGHAPPAPPKVEGVEPAPPLFEAMQQQTGLKLEAQKTAVSVIAIDHIDKPTAN